MKKLLLVPVLLTLVACGPPNSPSASSTPPPISAITSTPAAIPSTTPAPGALHAGQDQFGRDQLRARDGAHEVSVDRNSDGSYQVVYSTWISVGDGAESASGTPFRTDGPASAAELEAFLAKEPAFRSLGLTVTEALAGGKHPEWQLRPEDQDNVAKMLVVLRKP